MTLYAEESDYLHGNGGHSWWNLYFNPGDLQVGDLIDYTGDMNFGLGGFFPEFPLDFENPVEQPGEVRFGPAAYGYHTESASYTWGIFIPGLTQALGYVDSVHASPGMYHLLNRNCTDIAVTVGENAGVNTISTSGVTTPNDLISYIENLE